MIQLDFLNPPNEIDIVKNDLKLCKESCDKIRKALFARHGELGKLYLELSNRLEILERNICRGE